jgi:hypothetical protein
VVPLRSGPARAVGSARAARLPAIEVKADGGQVIVEPYEGYHWEAWFGPGEITPKPATDRLLRLLGAVAGDGPARSSERWRPLDGGNGDLDEGNVEAARLLCEYFGGHDPVRGHDGTIGVYRPGKHRESASMTIGYIAPGVTKCWTDGWPPFEQGRTYDPAQLRQMAGLAVRTVKVPSSAVSVVSVATERDEGPIPLG